MHLVTWNCCRGPHTRKLPLLAEFKADLAVLQECARPEAESEQCLWFGDNPRQGILVIASGEYTLRALPRARGVPKYTIPIAVTGPESFTLFVIWAKGGKKDRYVMGVIKALKKYREHFKGGDVVVAGDINSNTIWDDDFPEHLNHTALVSMLAEWGLVSSYHEFFGEAHGAERRPTCYLLWKENRPYHIDYCFIPRSWLPRMQHVEVGTFEAWQKHSDHRPLVVRLAAR